MQFSPIRSAIIIIVAVLGILFTIPSFLPKNVLEAWPSWLPRQTVVLGLDLQGGSHLLLQVNRDSIVTERIKELRRDVRSVLANENGIGNIITTRPESITVELTDPTQHDAALMAPPDAAEHRVSDLDVRRRRRAGTRLHHAADGKIVVSLTPEGVKERMSSLVASRSR